jgi:hypothetical protein
MKTSIHQIIALWTHPRSISTAFERVMMERHDFTVLHEPFSYLYYVQKEGATIAQQHVDPNHPTDYTGIRSHIIDTAAQKPVFFKDMCSHCFNELRSDNHFLRRLTNTFLIRDPAKAIASYYAMNPEVTVEEIGLKQLYGIFEQIKSLGEHPVVIDADDLENNPEGIIHAYCKALGIRFIGEALTWESEHKEQWKIWKDWHKDASQSTGICKNMEKFSVTINNSDHLRAFYEDQVPYYRILHANRIKPQLPK